MASVTGLLANTDLFHTQLARDLDLYTRADDADWADADGAVDFDRLADPGANGLRTTENLIDALFNPVPTASARVSPFTVYDPARAQEAEARAYAAEEERQSTHSSTSSSLTEGSKLTEGSGGKTPSVYTAGSERSRLHVRCRGPWTVSTERRRWRPARERGSAAC